MRHPCSSPPPGFVEDPATIKTEFGATRTLSPDADGTLTGTWQNSRPSSPPTPPTTSRRSAARQRAAPFAQLRDAAERITGNAPNVDFALAALTAAFGLPADAPLTLFALARSTGWIAHALEQHATGSLIRPRAHYVGPPVGGR